MTISKFKTVGDAKKHAQELHLKRRRAEVIERMKGADDNERRAVIRHIDGFLPSATPAGKTFWLKIRREIEKQIERAK